MDEQLKHIVLVIAISLFITLMSFVKEPEKVTNHRGPPRIHYLRVQ